MLPNLLAYITLTDINSLLNVYTGLLLRQRPVWRRTAGEDACAQLLACRCWSVVTNTTGAEENVFQTNFPPASGKVQQLPASGGPEATPQAPPSSASLVSKHIFHLLLLRSGSSCLPVVARCHKHRRRSIR